MKKSLLKKLPIFIISIILFFVFFDSQNKTLEKKLNSNDTLLLKFKEFKKGDIEKEINFSSELIEGVIDTAKNYIGTPNKIGGGDYDSMDASGLVQVSLEKNKLLKFPRIAEEMARYGEIITDVEDLKKGDLVFFFDTYTTKSLITSVGIYLGNNEFITSTSKKGVSINKMDNPTFTDNYWMEHFFYGTRIFK
ncbi:C40 family peptidase [Flavobacteriaceae bacterium]|nr:C40 family peptidase [Flavobacteriaceae bacterium]